MVPAAVQTVDQRGGRPAGRFRGVRAGHRSGTPYAAAPQQAGRVARQPNVGRPAAAKWRGGRAVPVNDGCQRLLQRARQRVRSGRRLVAAQRLQHRTHRQTRLVVVVRTA